MTIIWCMVPEIWSMMDRIFVILDYFLYFYPPNILKNQNFEKIKRPPRDIITLHMCNKNDNHMIYGSWDMECEGQNCFVILDHFLPLYPSKKPKNQNFEKMKKAPGDIIILYICTINDNHMMHGSRDIEHDRQNFLSFWNIILPFYPKKSKFCKTEKKNGDIIILHECTKNHDHML